METGLPFILATLFIHFALLFWGVGWGRGAFAERIGNPNSLSLTIEKSFKDSFKVFSAKEKMNSNTGSLKGECSIVTL